MFQSTQSLFENPGKSPIHRAARREKGMAAAIANYGYDKFAAAQLPVPQPVGFFNITARTTYRQTMAGIFVVASFAFFAERIANAVTESSNMQLVAMGVDYQNGK